MGIFEQMQADAAAAPQAPQSLLDQMRMDAVAPVTTAAPQP